MFLDSWVWIEYFSSGSESEEAKKAIEKLKISKGVVSTFVLTEVKYRIAKKHGIHLANHVMHVMKSIQNLSILPVISAVAVYAADLRLKYYSKICDLSYGDSIHLATAILSGCKAFYTGDPDFSNITEIKIEKT